MRWEKHWLTGNVGLSTAHWFSIFKISRIVHTIDFILQFLYLASEFKDSISIFDQFFSSQVSRMLSLEIASILPFHWAQFCFNNSSWTSWWSCRRRSSPWWSRQISSFATRSFRSTFEYFFCRNLLGIRVFESLLDSQRESALFVAPGEVLICSLSELCFWVSWALVTSEQTTGLPALTWLTDDDRQDDRPSSSEWSARFRHGSRSVLPMVTSS